MTSSSPSFSRVEFTEELAVRVTFPLKPQLPNTHPLPLLFGILPSPTTCFPPGSWFLLSGAFSCCSCAAVLDFPSDCNPNSCLVLRAWGTSEQPRACALGSLGPLGRYDSCVMIHPPGRAQLKQKGTSACHDLEEPEGSPPLPLPPRPPVSHVASVAPGHLPSLVDGMISGPFKRGTPRLSRFLRRPRSGEVVGLV